MHVKSVVSALALSAAFALSGPAFAQTVFNGAELSADDLPAVTERCQQLLDASEGKTTGDASTGAQASDSETPDTTGDNATTPTDTPVANEVEAATTATIDLDTITLEMCTEAGLPAPAM